MKSDFKNLFYQLMVYENIIEYTLENIDDIIEYPHLVLFFNYIALLIVYTPLIIQEKRRKYIRL